MNIALIAHDNKKELMVQFCTAYCGILAKHTLCATATTGLQIGGGHRPAHPPLPVLRPRRRPADWQPASPITSWTWFSASATPITKVPDEDVANIFRLCDQNNIPYASNVATAEMLVLGLARGDLDWRDIVNPKTKPFHRLTSGPEMP